MPKHKIVRTIQTTLTRQQIVKKLEKLKNELKDDYYIWYDKKRTEFIVRKKLHGFSRKFPIRVYVKGNITRENDVTTISLSLSDTMNLKDLLIFAIPTFLIMLYTGKKMGESLLNITTAFVIVTVLIFLLTHIASKFTKIGKDLCEETIDMLERQFFKQD